MKVSLNLVKFINQHYACGADPYSYGVDEVLSRIGAQLGAVEDVTYFGARFNGIVVAKIISCEKHPDADKLNVCKVDDGGVVENADRGEDGYVQVVCGAPNAREGLTVAWLPPGVTVPSTVDKDPFVLSVREIRGVKSNGMIASPAELGLSDNHDGILEIDESEVGEELSRPGTEFKNLYGLDDVIIDCENKMFTHRPDCFGTLGVAREIAGIFGDSYKSPDWYMAPLAQIEERGLKIEGEVLQLEVKNEIPELVPRFMMQAVSNVEVKPSPLWLQSYLARVGMKSINNIVDYSNYFMMLTAQPTHAFDYDKVVALASKNVEIREKREGVSFAPRLTRAGEKLALLNGKTINLDEQDMVITANDIPIALAGVMGGSETEVDETTKNIVIECATFDMYAIRRTSMRHGLFTDAVTRYTKGQSPLQNASVLAKLVDEIVTFANGSAASEVFDIYNESRVKSLESKVVDTTSEFINSRLGSSLTVQEIKALLENVEFTVEIPQSSNLNPQSETLRVSAPFWRMDIELPEDVVEEIGRLYGYDKLPVELPARSSKPAGKNPMREFKNSLRTKLKQAGANELLTYSFVHGDLQRNTGTDPDKWAYHLRNAISPDLQYYRTSLAPSILSKVNMNIRAHSGDDSNEFAIYEIGKAHVKGEMEADDNNLPKQMTRLALVFASDSKTSKKYGVSAYYQAKKYLETITNGQAVYLPLDTNEYPITSSYQIGRSAVVMVNEQMLGCIGEYNQKTKKSLKLPEFCAGFELDLDLLNENLKAKTYQPLSTFPGTKQDITFEVDGIVTWGHLEQLIHAELAVAKAELGYNYDLSPLDVFKEDESSKKRISFRIEFTRNDKTIKTEEINALLENVSKALHEIIGAKRI